VKTLPDTFVHWLGPLRPLLADEAVSALVLEGTQRAWVEREGAPPRPAEAVSDEALDGMVGAIKEAADETGGPWCAALPGGGQVSVVETPDLLGGHVVVVETLHSRTRALSDLAPQDLALVLTAMLRAGVGVLVTGETADLRAAALQALLQVHPRITRRVVVDSRSVTHEGALQLRPHDLSPEGVARFFSGVELLRPGVLCLPELAWGGVSALRAAATCGRALGSCPGTDAEGALGLLLHGHEASHPLAMAAFRAVVEVVHGDRPSIRAVRECRLSHGQLAFHTLWVRHGSAPEGAWRDVPGFADRLALPGPPPWKDLLVALPRPSASMFADRVAATSVTELPFGARDPTGPGLALPPFTTPGMDLVPPEFTVEQAPQPRPAPSPPPPPADLWDDDTSPASLRGAKKPLPVEEPAAAPAPPLMTDLDADAFGNTSSLPTVPRVPRASTENSAGQPIKEGSSYRMRKPPPPVPGPLPSLPERKPPPLPPPPQRRGDQPSAARSAPPPPQPATRVATRPHGVGAGDAGESGDNHSGVFVSAKKDPPAQ
jgi:hypothetical protein